MPPRHGLRQHATEQRTNREEHLALEAIGFGLFVPVFFIVSGARLDLNSFGRHPAALAAIPLYAALLLAIRGLPTLLVYRRALPTRPDGAWPCCQRPACPSSS